MQTKEIIYALGLSTTLLLSSCSSKFHPLSSSQVQADPNPLELVGNKVPAKVHIAFPAKWFPKNGSLKIVPVLRYQGGERWAEAQSFQGEKVFGNDPVISYSSGGNVVVNVAIPYLPQMNKSELYLTFQGKVGSSQAKLPELKVANGLIATEAWATVAGILPAVAPDGFQRIINQEFDANIMFQIQQANVRNTELQKEDFEEWRYIVQNAKETPNQEVSVEVQSYASPDGGQKLNEKLSESRERNTTTALRAEFKRQKVSGVDIDAHYTAQDWEGFKTLVEQSNLPDKDLVLRVLSMYPDPQQKEQEIRNISAVFSQLADDILPKLRRSRLIANIKIVGKSDQEIKDWLAKAPGFLTIEELLYAATLAQTPEEKERIYQLVNSKYPQDYKAYNNIAALMIEQGRYDTADFWLKQAQKYAPENLESKLNYGILALYKGDLTKATELISSASTLPAAGQALGYIFLKQGEYDKAEKAFGDVVSTNAVVAQILNRNYSKALQTLDKISTPSAVASYLRAIIASRSNDSQTAIQELRKAINLDHSLSARIDQDMEFSKLAGLAEFRTLVTSEIGK